MKFTTEELNSNVISLTPGRWSDMTMLEGVWFVDFFAPWCPPCKAILPMFRAISKELKDINFGTVDCVAHGELCQKFNINSYPTKMIINETNPNVEFINHLTQNFLEIFIDELKNPSTVTLDPEIFYEKVQNRPVGEVWIVDFYAEWCGPCQQLMPEIRKLAKDLKGVVKVGKVDCGMEINDKFCKRQQITGYPEIRLYPARKTPDENPVYAEFSGHDRRSFALAMWASSFIGDVGELNTHNDYVEIVENRKSPVLVHFTSARSSQSATYSTVFAKVSNELKDVKFVSLSCNKYPGRCQKLMIHTFPAVFLYDKVGGLVGGQINNAVKIPTDMNPEKQMTFFKQIIYKHDEL